ncbi:hypothetical protein [Mesorhizobium marinum]|uniref:MarR family transcriptional regulator n=1 Tax=Mesorhizobium marinum TaxID=3228790 RepID=A0ABV3R2A3_9HYPH
MFFASENILISVTLAPKLTKKRRVGLMLKRPGGVKVATIMSELDVTEPAAKALIGDVRREGNKVTLDRKTAVYKAT